MLLVLLFLEDRSIFHTAAVRIVTVFRFYYILYTFFLWTLYKSPWVLYKYKSKQNKNPSIRENKTTVYSLKSSVLYRYVKIQTYLLFGL